MMVWILSIISAACLLVMLLLVKHNQRHAFRLEHTPRPLAIPKVSVLIPARNEANNLKQILPKLLQNHYPNWELLVLDDFSLDETTAVVESWIPRSDGKLRLLHGQPLPAGWNGKNWACSQLAQQATGEVLIFCDADVLTGSCAISHTVSMLQHSGAGVVTVIPYQEMQTWSEQAIVPLVMHFPTLGWVPLRLASLSLRPSLTVANGQWLAFSRPVYKAIGGHEAVRDEIVEDMALCKRVKQHGFRVVTALAFAQLSVRMYQNFSAVRAGFSKNLFGLTQFRGPIFAGVFVFYALTTVLPWILPWVTGMGWLPLLLLVALRIQLAQLATHPPGAIWWHPVGSVLLLGIAWESWWRTLTRRLSWKDRELLRPSSSVVPPR